MKRNLICLSFVILGLSTLACSANSKEDADGSQDTDARTGAEIEDVSWTLVELNGESVTTGERRAAPSLQLESATGRAAGSTGVNRFSGTYEMNGASLEFSIDAVTSRASFPEAMVLETRYLDTLRTVDAWRMAEGGLELLHDSKVVARYKTDGSASDGASSTAKIIGTASFRERIALPPQAVFSATLQDVSRADAKAQVIGKVRLDPAGNPPYSFAITYDPAAIDERHSYAVRATITVGDRLLFTSDTAHPVLTRGAGNSVEILLTRVAAK